MQLKTSTIGFVITLLSGGLAGAIFTSYVNRPKTTVLSYSLGSTTIADTEATSIIPNLKVQIGNEVIRNLYTHTVVFGVANGPQVDSGEIAITFAANTNIYGDPSIGTPSPVHHLDCSRVPNGLVCKMAPVRAEDKLSPYRVAMATDQKAEPTLVTTTKGLELQPAQEALSHETQRAQLFKNISLALTVLSILIALRSLAILIANRS